MRKKKPQEHENHERWLVSYADFITLLFAFFTVMYATSSKDMVEAKKFENSIRRHLIKFGGFVGGGGTGAGKVNEKQQYNRVLENPLKTYKDGDEKLAATQKAVEVYVEKELTKEQLDRLVLDIQKEGIAVRVSLYADEIFAPGTNKLRPESVPVIKKLVQYLKASKHKVFVEAHTSSGNLPKGMRSTWEYTALRSSLIVQYFIKVFDFPADRLVALSYGDSRPIVPNTSIKNRKINRRIDFLLLTEDSPF